MYEPRPYQQAAVDSLFEYFKQHGGNPLIVLPTGSGKSIVQAVFIETVLDRWPAERFLLLTHIKEIIGQNESKLSGAIDVGVYSAGLGRRELGHQVTIGGIQSLHRKWHEVGDTGIVIIDEAHLVTKTSNTMYQRFLAGLRSICPYVKVIGMSATPFRLDSGPLHKGENRIFTDIAYSISIKELIEQGYLAPLVLAPVKKRVDTSDVKRRGGEFEPGDLERVMMGEGNTEAALDEVERLAGDRRGWLVFCVGVAHAASVADAIRARGHACGRVVGDTPKKERATIIEAFKTGQLRALVSVGVLTTGFDAPSADALVCLRPTLSPGLWVQMVGRVGRTAPGKADGLVLDFTSNSSVHGPVDQITIDGDGNVKLAPDRVCPGCGELNRAVAKECHKCGASFKKYCLKCEAPVDIDSRMCPECGLWFGQDRAPKHNSQASGDDIISSDQPTKYEVVDWQFNTHRKAGKPPSLRVTYWTDGKTYQEWVCLQHSGYASQKAAIWWVNHGGVAPTPLTVVDALGRLSELTMPGEIQVKRDGKYWRVM